MGRKGVSKRKSKQEKSKPMSAGAASGSVASAMQAADSQPVKTFDTAKGGSKPTTAQKKTPKKG